MYEDIGKLDKAFAHLSEGNALRKKLLKYSINQDQELFTKLRNNLSDLLYSSLEIKEDSNAYTNFHSWDAKIRTTLKNK